MGRNRPADRPADRQTDGLIDRSLALSVRKSEIRRFQADPPIGGAARRSLVGVVFSVAIVVVVVVAVVDCCATFGRGREMISSINADRLDNNDNNESEQKIGTAPMMSGRRRRRRRERRDCARAICHLKFGLKFGQPRRTSRWLVSALPDSQLITRPPLKYARPAVGQHPFSRTRLDSPIRQRPRRGPTAK